MTLPDLDRLPHLKPPTQAEARQVETICGTIAEYMTDANELVRKAVVSRLVRHYGTLEQYSEDQLIAFKTNYRQKKFYKPAKPKWGAR